MIVFKQNIQKPILLSLYLIICLGLFGQTNEETTSILAPRSHNPAFVEPGGVIEVELRDSSVFSTSQWRSKLKNDLSEWEVKVKSTTLAKIHNGTENGTKLTIIIPQNIPPELMELTIYHPSGVEYRSPRSVSIVSNFEKDFYIIHQSDEHMTIDKAVEPGGKSSVKWGNGSKEALQWLTPIFNIINPRFVLHTGDNTQIYHEADSWGGIEEAQTRMEKFIDGISGYQVPTILLPGNHDIGFPDYVQNLEWRKTYYRTIGKTTFSFKMGSFYFLGSEWTNPIFLDWAKKDYELNYADSLIKYRLLASHYYDGLDAITTIANEKKPADLLLVGHNHRTRILQTKPYPVLSVGSAQQYQRGAFFYFHRTPDGWTTSQPLSHAEGVNVHQLIGDYGLPTVFSEFTKDNDGTAELNKVTITNKLPFNFFNGRVRFLMKQGNYSVKGGEVLSVYDYDNGKKTAVIVKVNIQQNSLTELSIKKI